MRMNKIIDTDLDLYANILKVVAGLKKESEKNKKRKEGRKWKNKKGTQFFFFFCFLFDFLNRENNKNKMERNIKCNIATSKIQQNEKKIYIRTFKIK